MIFDRFFTGNEGSIMNYLSMMQHFQPFARGLIDTADIAYFLLFIIAFLTLTIRRLDADRLRG
jgi:ABC-2 type transport system permease protein